MLIFSVFLLLIFSYDFVAASALYCALNKSIAAGDSDDC